MGRLCLCKWYLEHRDISVKCHSPHSAKVQSNGIHHSSIVGIGKLDKIFLSQIDYEYSLEIITDLFYVSYNMQ
jgi:hypothetical protein